MRSKFARIMTKTAVSPTVARPGAMMRVQTPRPFGFRLNHMMMATEVMANRKTSPNAAALVSQVNRVITGNKSPSSWLMPVIAKPATTTMARPDCSIEPLRGAPFLAIRPKKPGRTAEGEEVPCRGIVEGQEYCQQAGHEQYIGKVRQHR